ncbi:hypothetical protein DL96DRAFT_1574634 [Flagelloscypha sp. PMI_526]|nr:hypothetical protein DL96DRAFT_1574634 [Flagelloscypha sp. PMI_526]
MDTKKNDAFSDDNLRLWENAYDLKSLCNGPGDIEELMDKPEEIRRFFHRLLGALEFKEGFPAVYAWVIRLIDPDGPSSSQPSTSTIKVNHSTPPVSESSTQSFMSSPPRPAPQSGSSSSSNITLAMLNQKASQNQMKVEYPAESTGPPHNPTWAVRCLLDGKEKGFGRAKSQKAAKEAAAQQAWQSMGW